MEGRINIDEAFLKLSRVQAAGNLYNGKITDVTHVIPVDDPPFQLSAADSAEMNFSLPAGTYDHLEFNLFLFQDNYALAMMANPPAEAPPPAQNDDPATGGQEAGDTDSGNNNGNDGTPGADGDDDEDAGDNTTDGDHNDNGNNEDDGGQHSDGKDKGKKNDHKDKKDKKKGDKGHGGHNGRNGASQVTDEVNLDDFFRNAKPGLLVVGTYENNGKTIRLIFVASGLEKVGIQGKQNDSLPVVLANKNTAWITFDPERWFASVTPADIEAGSTQLYQGQPVLFIHANFNPEIYQALAPQLEASADLVFDLNNF